MRALSIELSFAAALAALVGCTEIPDNRVFVPADGGSFAGQDGGDGSGGSHAGGSTGNGGSSNGGTSSGGSGGAGTCDLTQCSGDTVTGLGSLSPCCATSSGATGSVCGLDLGAVSPGAACLELGAPGLPSPDCPAVAVASQDRTGCCREGTSTCGIDLGPLGCADPAGLGLEPGGSCTPTVCANGPGTDCVANADCCDTTGRGAVCVTFTGDKSGKCTDYCTLNSECTSNCCVWLTNGLGACTLDAASCSPGCRETDETCDKEGDCCAGSTCVAQFEGGPKLCRPTCFSQADCFEGVCIQDPTTFTSACSRKEVGLCTNTCVGHDDGSCEDGGNPGDSYTICAYGSDCNDCGPRIGGNALCDDSCNSLNGICEDGGTYSSSYTCTWGTDCTDCGPRSSICVNTCYYANDGVCDYDTAKCAPGTDCADCGQFYGGRNEGVCDGTYGTFCTGPAGGAAGSLVGDGLCECQGCGWDASDCGSTSYCNGSSISYCCTEAGGDVCGIGSDGMCDCGGWCSWETSDCGAIVVPTTPKCDYSQGTCCGPDNGCAYSNDGFCDCQGACPWDQNDCAASYICSDSCLGYNSDGICEDGGTGSSGSFCAYGSDCTDCGARSAGIPIPGPMP